MRDRLLLGPWFHRHYHHLIHPSKGETRMLAKLKKFLKTPAGKVGEHLAVVFGGTFATTLYFNGEHVLAEGGLSAVKSAAPALIVTALVGAYAALKPQLAALAAKLFGSKS